VKEDMLLNILREIEKSQGAISLTALSDNLDIQKSALQAILQFWMRKGKIQIIHDPLQNETLLCANLDCSKPKCNSSRHSAKKKLIY
jgi:hypothetical protein